MKQRIFTLTFLFTLFCNIGSQAQDVLIQGSRLDIGSEMNLVPSTAVPLALKTPLLEDIHWPLVTTIPSHNMVIILLLLDP